MPRSQPPLRLKRSPLVHVLAQVRTAPVLKMADYIGDIQEQLRKAGFPRYVVAKTTSVSFGPTPTVQEQQRWVFASKDQTEAVVISSDFVVLVTSRYDRFEAFCERLVEVLQVVGGVVDFALVHRLGLRYVDLILPEDGQGLNEYLQTKLHGLSAADLDTEVVLNQFESRGQTPHGTLVVRLHQNNAGVILPPDLDRDTLSFEHIPAVAEGRLRGGVVTLLDIDHFSREDRDFEVPGLVKAMWSLHDYTDKAFRASVTEAALERWGHNGQ